MAIRTRTLVAAIVNGLVLVAAVATGWRVIAGIRPPSPSENPSRNLISPGRSLNVPGVDWTSRSRHAVVLVSTTCRPCLENAGFYRELASRTKADPKTDFIVLSPEPAKTVSDWLKTEQIVAQSIVQVSDPASEGFLVYPTFLLVNDRGVVTDALLGPIRGQYEVAIWSRFANTAAAPLNNTTYAPEVLSDAELSTILRGAEAQLLDIRDRPDYATGHRAGAVNIPADELPSRAPVELRRTDPIVLLCFEGAITPCRSVGNRLRNAGFPGVILLIPPTPPRADTRR
jgi:rhodanese-related sulfurtransferase